MRARWNDRDRSRAARRAGQGGRQGEVPRVCSRRDAGLNAVCCGDGVSDSINAPIYWIIRNNSSILIFDGGRKEGVRCAVAGGDRIRCR
jgi:hypothetical protein